MSSTKRSIEGFEEDWNWILDKEELISDQLKELSLNLPQGIRARLTKVIRFIQSSASADEALLQPDVLSLTLPLIDISRDGEPQPADINRALREGFCLLGQRSDATWRILTKLAYPLIIFGVVACIGISFSIWLAPQFEEIYEEFGIQLPAITILTLKLASFVRASWKIVVGLTFGCLLILFILRTGRSQKRDFDLLHRLVGNRNSLAAWAWHQALLLKAGFDWIEAIRIAGKATQHPRLANSSQQWAHSLRDQPDVDRVYFQSPDFALLNAVMNERGEGRQIGLREVAMSYWTRGQTVNDWWIHWAFIIFMLFLGGLVLLIVTALFLPLIQLVSGLTGW